MSADDMSKWTSYSINPSTNIKQSSSKNSTYVSTHINHFQNIQRHHFNKRLIEKKTTTTLLTQHDWSYPPPHQPNFDTSRNSPQFPLPSIPKLQSYLSNLSSPLLPPTRFPPHPTLPQPTKPDNPTPLFLPNIHHLDSHLSLSSSSSLSFSSSSISSISSTYPISTHTHTHTKAKSIHRNPLRHELLSRHGGQLGQGYLHK